MMSCSAIYAPLRWLLRYPTLGHRIMHPRRAGHALIELECVECLRVWMVRSPLTASDEYARRRDAAIHAHQEWCHERHEVRKVAAI